MPAVREIDDVTARIRPWQGDFTLEVAVSAGGVAFADAAGVLVRCGRGGWFKCCVERMRDKAWAICSVVSSPTSDEARGPRLTAGAARFLVTRESTRFGFFWRSPSEEQWTFGRTWTWPVDDAVQLGVFGQAPFSGGCPVSFGAPRIDPKPLKDRR